jgi:hypothetical protein
MELAPGALTNDTSISVSATPITAADYDGTVTPITPLYSVEPGDVTLHQLATVILAADVPAGAAALMFQYDDTAGKLTPVAPLSADVKGLTFAITHFAPLFGALVDSAQLPAIADSGFRPGQDDWQFTNWGSYVYAGHCQGMSISAIWYYTTQHKGAGAPQLNGLHDNNGAAQKTPDFQLDDSDAYRFTGVVQKDPVANPTAYAYAKLALFDADNRLTYASLRAAIALTGEPQLIHIKAADGSYHAIIVYRVTPERLFVADPNYPGRLRTIRYDAATGKLATYQSGDTAAEITNYTQFAYVPWRARESEAALAADWAALTAGTSGDGLYPAYTLSVRTAGTNESWVELSDGYRTDAAAITVAVTLPQKVSYYAYRGTKLLPPTGDIALDEGVNELGFNIVGEVVNNNVVPPEVAWKYIDFQRFNVFRGPEPTPPSSFEESPAPPPDATAQPGAGEWVLQELIPVPAQDPDSDCYFGNQVALGDGGFTSVGSWKDDGCVSGGRTTQAPSPALAAGRRRLPT